jgi:hypothetical protein
MYIHYGKEKETPSEQMEGERGILDSGGVHRISINLLKRALSFGIIKTLCIFMISSYH